MKFKIFLIFLLTIYSSSSLADEQIRDASKNSDIHIDILRFVQESEVPVSVFDIAKHLNIDPEKIRWIEEEGDSGGKTFIRNQKKDTGWSFTLSMKGRQILLDYENMRSARESSTIATWIAIFAILLSVISLLSSMYYSRKQMNSGIRFDEVELRKFGTNKIVKSVRKLERTQKDSLYLLEDIRKNLNEKESRSE